MTRPVFSPIPCGFALVELLVSTVIISLLLVVLVSMTGQTVSIWRNASAKVEQFSHARDAFESLTRHLTQATLNTYWDYYDSAGRSASDTNYNGTPSTYGRQSDLRFISQPGVQNSHELFFQAPFGYSNLPNGLESLLNTWGYYIAFDREQGVPPFLVGLNVPARYRFRLMEYMEPSENLQVYANPGTAALPTWFPATLPSRATYSHVLAENVIALILLPKLPPREDASGTQLAPTYAYDSTLDGPNGADSNYNTKNQLPPVVQVTMVAVEETSFSRFQGTSSAMPALGLESLFRNAGDLHNPINPGYARDLETLKTILRANKINYRIFTTDVVLRGAKWSRE